MAHTPDTAKRRIALTLDGQAVDAAEGDTVLALARRHGRTVPTLCHTEGMAPAGNCRACMVEVQGERSLAAACCREVADGMVVDTASPRARAAQKMVLELLLADQGDGPHRARGQAGLAPAVGRLAEPSAPLGNELDHWARVMAVGQDAAPRLPARRQPAPDLSHPAIAVNMDACIQCTRCLRACREQQVNDVIGIGGRGEHTAIVFDLDDPLAASSCVACGECVQACPTGALMPAQAAALVPPERSVDSLCPFCGVGCALTYHIRDGRIAQVTGRAGPANDGRLCVKGRWGFDYVHHPQRLTVPLIRRDDAPPKHGDMAVDADTARRWFREASWDEALARAAQGLRRIRDTQGPHALAGFGSAKGSNEEAYLFQKLVRLGLGSNNVDHCTRLCHASSVAALLEGIGSGAVSNPVRDVALAEVLIVIGANPPVNHPVAASWIKNAVKAGTRLVLMDPRRGELARHAEHVLNFKPGTDVALLNAMLHVVVNENLVDQDFVRSRTEGYEALARHVQAYSPEAMAPLCGIDAGTIRTVARLYAGAKTAMILWGMGVSQHVHGTDNARCLIALALATGQIGRPGTGLHPLRGQNNVQGASDAGLIPMMYPNYQRVDAPEVRQAMAAAWGVAEAQLDPTPGLTVVEVMDAALAGRLRGLYVMGENPAMSDPQVQHVRQALAQLEHLVVQDIFLTETAAFADVVLPASAFAEKTGSFTNTDRLVQLGRAALPLPGQARQDLWIIQRMAEGLGLRWPEQSVEQVYEEMRATMGNLAGIPWSRLLRDGHATYPCDDADAPGQSVVFSEGFPRPNGRARFVPADIVPPDEQPDADYPLVLITGRLLEHWHTGSMTRRTRVLDALEPEPTALVHPLDLAAIGARPGEVVTLRTRRGSVSLYARVDEGMARGAVFVPFAYAEAAINRLTNPALDPFGKIAELKYCAVRMTAAPAEAAPGAARPQMPQPVPQPVPETGI